MIVSSNYIIRPLHHVSSRNPSITPCQYLSIVCRYQRVDYVGIKKFRHSSSTGFRWESIGVLKDRQIINKCSRRLFDLSPINILLTDPEMKVTISKNNIFKRKDPSTGFKPSDQMRAQIEMMMGTTEESESAVRFTDDTVCRMFLLDCCPYGRFDGCKIDIPNICTKTHSPRLRADFERLGSDLCYEIDAFLELKDFMDEMDVEIRSKENILRNSREKMEKQLRHLESNLAKLVAEIDSIQTDLDKADLECPDNITNDESLNFKLDSLVESKQKTEHSIRMLVLNLKSQGNLRLCDVCGGFLSENRDDSRVINHHSGKQHTEFAHIRQKLSELRQLSMEKKQIWKQRQADIEAKNISSIKARRISLFIPGFDRTTKNGGKDHSFGSSKSCRSNRFTCSGFDNQSVSYEGDTWSDCSENCDESIKSFTCCSKRTIGSCLSCGKEDYEEGITKFSHQFLERKFQNEAMLDLQKNMEQINERNVHNSSSSSSSANTDAFSGREQRETNNNNDLEKIYTSLESHREMKSLKAAEKAKRKEYRRRIRNERQARRNARKSAAKLVLD